MVDLQDFGRSLVENPVAPPPDLSMLQRRARRLRRRQLTVAITAVGVIGLSGVALLAMRDVHRHDVTLATRPAQEPSATEATEAGLQMVARSYVTAWLTSSPGGITSVRSKTCAGSSGGATGSALASFLTMVQRNSPDVKLSDVKVSAIQVRNFQGTTGEAEAEFDPTPGFVAGNGNWIRYAYEDGTWKVLDCAKLPFGGTSTAATSPKP